MPKAKKVCGKPCIKDYCRRHTITNECILAKNRCYKCDAPTGKIMICTKCEGGKLYRRVNYLMKSRNKSAEEILQSVVKDFILNDESDQSDVPSEIENKLKDINENRIAELKEYGMDESELHRTCPEIDKAMISDRKVTNMFLAEM